MRIRKAQITNLPIRGWTTPWRNTPKENSLCVPIDRLPPSLKPRKHLRIQPGNLWMTDTMSYGTCLYKRVLFHLRPTRKRFLSMRGTRPTYEHILTTCRAFDNCRDILRSASENFIVTDKNGERNRGTFRLPQTNGHLQEIEESRPKPHRLVSIFNTRVMPPFLRFIFHQKPLCDRHIITYHPSYTFTIQTYYKLHAHSPITTRMYFTTYSTGPRAPRLNSSLYLLRYDTSLACLSLIEPTAL